MPKSAYQRLSDRARFALLSSQSSWIDRVSITIDPQSPNHAVCPIAFYAQSCYADTFGALDSIGTIWNAAPRRFITISRLDESDQVVISSSYALIRSSPRDAEIMLAPLEVAAVDSAVVKGKKLRMEMDDILGNNLEWQAGYINYKQLLANDS